MAVMNEWMGAAKSRLWTLGMLGLDAFSNEQATRLMHQRKTRRRLDLRTPRRFDEKLQWLKLFHRDPLMARCADKLGLHDYASSRVQGAILNDLLGVYRSVDEIDWEALPDAFVLKCNHGCGYNILVHDKSTLERRKASQDLSRWMTERYGRRKLEYHYDQIVPRIFAERMLDSGGRDAPLDYKVYCFNGEPLVVLLCAADKGQTRYAYFDRDWGPLELMAAKVPIITDTADLARPACLEPLLESARALAEPFAFVRVDFYIEHGLPILGEMTFTPSANMDNGYSDEGLDYLGSLLRLPEERSSRRSDGGKVAAPR